MPPSQAGSGWRPHGPLLSPARCPRALPPVKPFPFHSLWPFPRACLHLCEQLWEVPGHAGSFLGFPAAQTDGD